MEIPKLTEEAIAELSPLVSTNLRPAHMLSLARRYQVDPWLQPSLTAFLSAPPSILTTEDLQLAGEETVLSYIQLHSKRSTFRMALILWPPPLSHDASCHGDGQQRCKAAFAKWWHSEISQLLIQHQTRGEAPSTTYKRVRDRLEIVSYAALAAVDDPEFRDKVIQGMTRKCQVDGIQGCLRFEALTKENAALEQAVHDLQTRGAEPGEQVSPAPGMDVDSSVETSTM